LTPAGAGVTDRPDFSTLQGIGMADQEFDVLGLGNAIVDVIARAEDDFLAREKMSKGSMSLIDEARTLSLYEAMGSGTMISGGSAANTIVGAASLGVKAAFIGKVKSDDVGHVFTHDIRATGVHFVTPPAKTGPSTARCLVLVTPDGERTMNTYLGACQNLTPDDVDEALVSASKITYLEGYLWDPPAAKQAFVKAAAIAHKANRQVALTLSDAFCVDRYRDEFLNLIREKTVDIVFANEHELKALYQTADFTTAVNALRNEGILGVVTRSENGSIVVTREETIAAQAFPIEKLVDTTGAGDLFAAGFLAGLTRDADYHTCARLGALAAAEVIQHYGARPEANLLDLARENGLI
jgi:sugar/nucleoside kinase (ribokinase family)